MKRFCLISCAAVAASMCWSSPVQAENTPAVLFIPTEDVTLIPSGSGACQYISMSEYNAALNCSPGLTEETPMTVVADAGQLTTDIAAALAPYNVMVTNERPPEYMPYYMLVLRDEMFADSLNYACAGGPLTCASRGRNAIGSTSGGTMFCMDPNLTQAGLYSFGRMAGLEGVDDPLDPMHYPPDFETPATMYQDACMAISPLFGGKKGTTPQPLECTSADHVDCDAMQQNSHADLLSYFGAFAEDTEAPVITVVSPEDGATIPEGEGLVLDASIEDADPAVAMRWTVESPALEGLDVPQLEDDGKFTFCTSNLCDVNFLDGDPFKPTDSSWAAPALNGLPGGEYTVTIEASDYHGNEAEPVVVTVTVEGGPATTGGTDTDTGDGTDSGSNDSGNNDSGPVFTTGDDSDGETGDGDGGGTAGMEEEEDGCGCTTGPAGSGSVLLMGLGLLGLATGRRRR